jgi:NTP pyrophosphatase (non-canonical NTP hydrolase)
LKNLGEELADVYILLCAVAGLTEIDLNLYVRDKMGVNKNRKWGKPDNDGVVEHI